LFILSFGFGIQMSGFSLHPVPPHRTIACTLLSPLFGGLVSYRLSWRQMLVHASRVQLFCFGGVWVRWFFVVFCCFFVFWV
jgi:hypothetical protein